MKKYLVNFLKKLIKSNHFIKLILKNLIEKTFLKRLLFLFLFKTYKFKRKYKEFNFKIILKKEIKNSNLSRVIINRKESLKVIEIHLSKNILNEISSIKRSYDCFEHWIRSIIKLAQDSDKLICLDFHMGDVGQKNYLSMEQDNTKNLIPDIYSFSASSQIIEKKIMKKEFYDFKSIWLRKKNKIFWRGTTTGRIYKSINELNSTNRIKICKRFKNVKNIDLKITKIKQNLISNKKVQKYLISEGLFASEVSEDVFASYRYYPDIPGNSLGWGTVRKYLSGNLIFKPYSKKILFYYQFLYPWVHYIPLKDDFSDLKEKFLWSQKNIDETINIAYRGYITIFDYLQNIDNYFLKSILKTEYKDF